CRWGRAVCGLPSVHPRITSAPLLMRLMMNRLARLRSGVLLGLRDSVVDLRSEVLLSPVPGLRPREPLRFLSHASQRPLRDRADEVRPDDERGGDAADRGPAWAEPGVDDAHARDGVRLRVELPDDVHAAGDALDVAVADRGLVRGAAHVGDPPGRVAAWACAVPPRGHLDDAVGESSFFPEVDVAVVRQDLGPAL